ncbi:hypothetical protein SH2C18_20310 [Clostridium sediminicola]|uniref:hypothetical protein n=1 Tax=Clostridium sediminicola TaxID=3114879 RepID=UPI0031F23027
MKDLMVTDVNDNPDIQQILCFGTWIVGSRESGDAVKVATENSALILFVMDKLIFDLRKRLA